MSRIRTGERGGQRGGGGCGRGVCGLIVGGPEGGREAREGGDAGYEVTAGEGRGVGDGWIGCLRGLC